MEIIDLNEEQVEDIEARLSSFDENYITYTLAEQAGMKTKRIAETENAYLLAFMK